VNGVSSRTSWKCVRCNDLGELPSGKVCPDCAGGHKATRGTKAGRGVALSRVSLCPVRFECAGSDRAELFLEVPVI
jgi:hypothetical protein